MTTKSVLLSTRLVLEYLDPEKCPERYGVEGISHLASLEVRFQTQMWGEVEDSMSILRFCLINSTRCGLRGREKTIRKCNNTPSSMIQKMYRRDKHTSD